MNNIKKKVTSIIAAATAVMCLGAMPMAGYSFGIMPDLSINASAADRIGYIGATGEYKTRSSYTMIDSGTTRLDGGWYAVSGKVTIEGRLKVLEDTYIILTDGSRLTVEGGIDVASGVKFNVYTQENASAALYAGTSNGSNRTAGYGNCGIGGKGAKINIVGGNVYAVGGVDAHGIYGSDIHLYWTNPTDSIYASSYSSTVQILSSFADKKNGAAYNNSSVSASSLSGTTLKAAQIVDRNTTSMRNGAYVVYDNVNVIDRILAEGNVELYLARGGVLTADEGITVASSDTLNIYGNGGKLYAGTSNGYSSRAKENNAGIGSEKGNRAGTIIINSGTVYANGGKYAAGIGGSTADVQILGGNVNATGGFYGAGIGSGYKDSGSTVDILGGKVTATGGSSAAGVGSGKDAGNSSIRLSYTSSDDSITASSFSGNVNFLKTMYTSDGQVANWRNINNTKLTSSVSAYTVSFETNGGNYVSPVTVSANSYMRSIPTPTRRGYTFEGWYTDSNLRTKFDYRYTTVNQNMTLYAKWSDGTYTVYFEANNGEYIGPKTVTAGNSIPVMPYVTREGYTFVGWYTDYNLRNRFNENSGIYEDMTLYAKWERVATATINFYIDGRPASSMTAEVGDTIGILDFPILLDSYTDGWYTNSSCTNYVGSSYYVSGNATLYAQTITQYATIYFCYDGTVGDSITTTVGDSIPSNSMPALYIGGHEYDGWYMDPGCTRSAGSSYYVSGDAYLYAKQKVTATYTVTFDAVGGSFTSGQSNVTLTLKEGETCYGPAGGDPYLEGMIFIGWHDGGGNEFSPFEVYSNKTYYAYYVADPNYSLDSEYNDYGYDYGSTFGGAGLIAAIAGGVAVVGGGVAAGVIINKKKKNGNNDTTENKDKEEK